jgi:glycosyltransferase involved in cell wall biosynthesis
LILFQTINLKISIVTVNLNDVTGLQRTLNSVLQQTSKDFEFIIMDGGSTDGSKDLIEKNADKLRYWVSEEDKGVYNAMNNGVAQTQSEYILFLNSGDELINKDVLQIVACQLSGEDIIYGNVLFVKEDGSSYESGFPAKLNFDFFEKYTLAHPATFIKATLLKGMGGYDESLKICADWKFFMEAIFKKNASYKRLETIVSRFYLDGISSLESNAALINAERTSVLQEEFPAFLEMHNELQKLRKLKNNWLVRSSIKAGFIKYYLPKA